MAVEERPIPKATVKQPRRYMVLPIDQSNLTDLILATRSRVGDDVIQMVDCDLPTGTRVVATKINVPYGSVDFLLYNPAWPEVEDWVEPPRIEARYWVYHVNVPEYKDLKSKTKTVLECPDCSGSRRTDRKCETCGGKGEVVALILGPAE